MPLVLDGKKKDDEAVVEPEPDHAAPLRADVLGSIAGADPNSSGYLGKINHLITAHGALEKMNPFGGRGPDFSGMTADADQTGMASSLMTPPKSAGFVGENNVPGSTATGSERAYGVPAMAAPQRRGWLGKIGHGLARMGNIAGDILAPGVMEAIPGTDMNKRFEAAIKDRNAARDRELGIKETTAQAEKLGAETRAKLEPSEEEKNRAEAFKDRLTPEAKTDFEAWQRQNPKAPVADWLALLAKNKPPTAEQDTARATQLRADKAEGKTLSPEDAAWLQGHTQEKTIVPAATVTLNQPKVANERADKSFQYNNTALDKIATPVDQINQRLGRLNDTLSQNSPQADALVAPELLSVMAGGAGSGLRMNEAEIARIVGGRSNWESLKASINKWSLDPKEALSITPDQRQQIRALARTVQDKLIAKERIIDDARNALIDSDDPKEHRKIIADAKKALDKIDAGEAVAGGTTPVRPANVPADYVFQENGPQGRGWYKPKSK